jgi:hypothetical protein
LTPVAANSQQPKPKTKIGDKNNTNSQIYVPRHKNKNE